MKKALFKDSIKEIKNTHKRFISILLMAFLGVGFFAGIRAASPDMKKTIDQYYDTQNVYDIEIVSTLGLNDTDIEALSQISGIDKVYGTYSKDVEISLGETEVVAKVHSLEENINNVMLLEGELPKNIDECVVEKNFISGTNKKIGDYIELEEKLSEDEESFFKSKTLKIVGVVQSPLYISRERGTSSLGSGTVDYYIYINRDNIVSDIYTEMYAKIDNSNLETGSEKYNSYISTIKDNIENIKTEREEARYNELVSEAQEKVNDAESELKEKQQEVNEEFAKADKEIMDAENTISNSETTIANNEKKANTEFKNAENKISNAKKELENSKKEFENQKVEANKQIESINIQLSEQNDNLAKVNQNIELLNNQLSQINLQLGNADNLTEEELTELNTKKEQLEKTIEELNNNKNQLTSAITQMQNGVQEVKNSLSEGEKQLNLAEEEISKNEKELKRNKTNTYNQIEKAKKEVADAKEKLEASKSEYAEKKADYEKQIKEAEEKIAEAKQKIADIKKAKWYILDRESNSGYNGFMQDTESVANIGKVFPIVFFIIATLISLTSMTRMVEEQRGQIGILKALGYSKLQIASKYILYASLASLVGGVIGIFVGCSFLPQVIWSMYSMMYEIPNFICPINVEYGMMGIILIFICIVGATVYAIWKELSHMPSVLMRPKAPKIGKRVLLEKIPFIWKRLNFNRKVTVRNIFRYKKRFLMTIIGIMGCTALILTGFGIKDAIGNLLTEQYGGIFKYDMQIGIKDDLNEEEYKKLIDFLNSKEEIQEKVPAYYTSLDVINNDKTETAQVIVPNDNSEIEKVIDIIDKNTKEKVLLEKDNILITDKLAELLGVEEGNVITIKNSEGIEKQVTVGKIVENYVYHYIYMSKELYTSLYDEEYKINVILTQNNNLSEQQENELAKEIISKGYVSSVSQVSSMERLMNDMMSSLNYVVIILIISSGLLAFVVLYNLANVNISERIRELATIKVLGFYDREVYDYISRETVLLTIIGIAFGLLRRIFFKYIYIKNL